MRFQASCCLGAIVLAAELLVPAFRGTANVAQAETVTFGRPGSAQQPEVGAQVATLEGTGTGAQHIIGQNFTEDMDYTLDASFVFAAVNARTQGTLIEYDLLNCGGTIHFVGQAVDVFLGETTVLNFDHTFNYGEGTGTGTLLYAPQQDSVVAVDFALPLGFPDKFRPQALHFDGSTQSVQATILNFSFWLFEEDDYHVPATATLAPQRPVVLIHGYKGSNATWGQLATLLSATGRTVKHFSWAGGSTEASPDISIGTLSMLLSDSLAAWDEELPISEQGVDLIGHSMGGLIARHYVAHHANHVKYLITLGTPHYGTYVANQAGQFPIPLFGQNSIQTVEMSLGSSFLWELRRDWLASPFSKPELLAIVGTHDTGLHALCPLPLFICAYPNDADSYDDIDGVVPGNSAGLLDLQAPIYFVPRGHTQDIATINSPAHESFAPIVTFLSGAVPQTPAVDDILDPNHPNAATLGLGNVLVRLEDGLGNPIDVEFVTWCTPGVRGNNWGRNDESGLYFASMVAPGSHRIVVGPNTAGRAWVTEIVDVAPHRTNVFTLIAPPADAAATQEITAGDSPAQNFAGTQVILDFASGPGGSVTVYRYNADPPGTVDCEAAFHATAAVASTLPHYWDIDSELVPGSFSTTITFGYDESELLAAGIAETELLVAHFDGRWLPLATEVDPEANTVSTIASAFSLFALVGPDLFTAWEDGPRPAASERLPISVYPNPASGHASVSYRVATTGLIDIGIYDVAGRLVRTLVRGAQLPGDYTLEWNGRNNDGVQVSTGVYFVQVDSRTGRPNQAKLILRR